MHAVDLTPIFQFLNPVLQSLLEGFAIFVAGWVMWAFHRYAAPLVGNQVEAQFRTSLNTALQNGVAAAMHQVEGAETAHSNVQVKGLVASWAAQYAVNHAPDAIDHFGLSPADLATKALAYLPPAPTDGTPVHVTPVDVKALPPVQKG